MQVFFKILCGMENSVDPDQTAAWSGSALFTYVILSENFGVRNFWTFTINRCIMWMPRCRATVTHLPVHKKNTLLD